MDDTNFQQAYSKHMSGDTQTARKLYEDILEKSPKHTDARYMLGTLLAESGALEDALAQLAIAAKQAPGSPMIQTNLGNVYFKLGKLDQAGKHYQQALKINPLMPETLFNLAIIFTRQNRLREAATHLERGLKINPNFSAARRKLGSIYRELNQHPAAIKHLGKFLEQHPDDVPALFDIGNAYAAQNKQSEALVYFRRILEVAPDNQSAQHAVAALTGQTTPTAPPEHVAQLFDEMSEKFDGHLKQLGYRVPEMLTELLLGISGDARFERAIDFGCGTGLLGAQIKSHVSHLTGIDLSPKMIALAGTKSSYDELAVSDICEFMDAAKHQYNLFMSTDVFIYIGDLSGIFQSVRNHVAPGAYFIFSIEETSERDYVLRPSGRYAQSTHYIESLAKTHDFSIRASRSIDLRMERTQTVKGNLFVLQTNQP